MSTVCCKEEENRRHFRQLFRHLRFATRVSQWDVLNDDLGHVDNPLGLTVQNLLVTDRPTREEESKDFHRLFLHLRPNVVEQRDRRHWVDDLLHGVLQNPHLRPDSVSLATLVLWFRNPQSVVGGLRLAVFWLRGALYVTGPTSRL